MARVAGQVGRAARMLRQPAFAVGFAVLALLLTCRPFVRQPRLSLALAYLQVFGAWATIIVALWLMSLWFGRDDRGGDRDV